METCIRSLFKDKNTQTHTHTHKQTQAHTHNLRVELQRMNYVSYTFFRRYQRS